MVKIPGILILILFLFSSVSFAQNKFTKMADDAYTDQQFMIALMRYQKAYAKVKKNKNEKDNQMGNNGARPHCAQICPIGKMQ